ncbi:putative pre-mRNA-splicing factor ATP-dependent RNA helicase [Platanthera zijinensis]|uniref:Pre-mRNA-splicing factor ATP-dependent RNA helicase n=1 Tax=Platanthera zijinensis TaxID=2320716 RepID=A0AAP0B984_9ASPA
MIHYNGFRTLGYRSQLVQVHPSSALETNEDGRLSDYVVYHELISTSRPFMRNVCAVDMAWVMPIMKKLEKMDVYKLRVLGFIWFGGGGLNRRVETECSNRRGEVAAPNGAFWGVSQGGRVETEQTPPEVHLFTLLPAAFAKNGMLVINKGTCDVIKDLLSITKLTNKYFVFVLLLSTLLKFIMLCLMGLTFCIFQYYFVCTYNAAVGLTRMAQSQKDERGPEQFDIGSVNSAWQGTLLTIDLLHLSVAPQTSEAREPSHHQNIVLDAAMGDTNASPPPPALAVPELTDLATQIVKAVNVALLEF